MIQIRYRVAASQIRQLVPDVLDLEDEPLVISSFLDYGMSTVGAYKEFVQQVEVKYRGEKFHYHLVLILDNESAIFAGREMFGYPKVWGQTNMNVASGGRLFHGNAERPAGRAVVEFEFVAQKLVPAPAVPEAEEVWGLNFRVVPSFTPGATPSIREFVPVTMDMEFADVWTGDGHIHFPRTSAYDPWVNVDILRYEGALYARNLKAVLRTRTFQH